MGSSLHRDACAAPAQRFGIANDSPIIGASQPDACLSTYVSSCASTCSRNAAGSYPAAGCNAAFWDNRKPEPEDGLHNAKNLGGDTYNGFLFAARYNEFYQRLSMHGIPARTFDAAGGLRLYFLSYDMKKDELTLSSMEHVGNKIGPFKMESFRYLEQFEAPELMQGQTLDPPEMCLRHSPQEAALDVEVYFKLHFSGDAGSPPPFQLCHAEADTYLPRFLAEMMMRTLGAELDAEAAAVDDDDTAEVTMPMLLEFLRPPPPTSQDATTKSHVMYGIAGRVHGEADTATFGSTSLQEAHTATFGRTSLQKAQVAGEVDKDLIANTIEHCPDLADEDPWANTVEDIAEGTVSDDPIANTVEHCPAEPHESLMANSVEHTPTDVATDDDESPLANSVEHTPTDVDLTSSANTNGNHLWEVEETSIRHSLEHKPDSAGKLPISHFGVKKRENDEASLRPHAIRQNRENAEESPIADSSKYSSEEIDQKCPEAMPAEHSTDDAERDTLHANAETSPLEKAQCSAIAFGLPEHPDKYTFIAGFQHLKLAERWSPSSTLSTRATITRSLSCTF